VAAKAKTPSDEQNISENRKARHDFFIEETYEAGVALQGTEVKSCRAGRVNLRDGYASVENGEVFLFNVHISPYEQASRFNHEPVRKRKLLLHRSEIRRLYGNVKEAGYTIVPLRLYFKAGRVKVELGLAKGKKEYDKRDDVAARDAAREIGRAIRGKNRADWD
jgi:SsrA-binding protein